MSRNLGEVLDQMLVIEGLSVLAKERLTKFGEDLRYKAPEQMNEMWGNLGELCTSMVGGKPPHRLEGWEIALIETLMNKKLTL